MSWPRDLIAGPGYTVIVLSFTQILGWGILTYPPVLMMPPIAAERGWSRAFCMSGLSVALATSGLLSPTSCGLIDRYGGNRVMSLGALAGMAISRTSRRYRPARRDRLRPRSSGR